MIMDPAKAESFDLQSYMTQGVERVVSEAVRATLNNPRESVFMARFAAASRVASRKCRRAEDAGEHIPLFLAFQSEGVLLEDHPGGCVLHEKRAVVERLLSRETV